MGHPTSAGPAHLQLLLRRLQEEDRRPPFANVHKVDASGGQHLHKVDQTTLKLDRREGGPELIIMFSDYDTTASKLSCDEIPLVQSFQPIGNELTFCVL